MIVVQEFRDAEEPREKGISMDADLIRWLAAARADVEVDQYLRLPPEGV
ncbi:hypothetical protein ACWCSD_04890 [Nonomuraea sp. NPDC001684]